MFDLASIGAGLPVAETIDSLPRTGNVAIQAPPGTGKTTLVPPALANHSAGRGKVIVTAPRPVAARAAPPGRTGPRGVVPGASTLPK